MTLDGVLNGTDVFLLVLNKDTESWLPIGGQVSHARTENSSPIDITNKGSGKFRELLAGEGLQTVDFSSEFIFNTEASFSYVKKASLDRSVERFRIYRGDFTNFDDVFMMITSFAETANDGNAVTASITFMASGEMQFGLRAEAFFTTPEGQFIVTPIAGDPENFYVREL